MAASQKNIFLVDDDETANFINEMQINRFSGDFNILTFTCARKALDELKNKFKIPANPYLAYKKNWKGWRHFLSVKTK